MIDTPECDKMAAVKDESQAIGEFISWLHGQGHIIAEKLTGGGGYELFQDRRTIEQMLADYYEIDLNKVEEEKRALLELQRTLNHSRDIMDGLFSGAVDDMEDMP
jgi:hypothetical protein